MTIAPAVWFPSVQTGTGTDVFTERLVAGLKSRGIRAEITWLPLRAEFAPWTVPVPTPPPWANVCHINSWLHPRFIPRNLQIVTTLHHSIHAPELQPHKGWLRAAYHRFWIAPVERRVLHRANQVVAVSQFVAEMAKKTLCDVPMQVIYNGIDTELFRPGNRSRQPGTPFRLLYIGSWKQLKGVDLLAPIMRELGQNFELHYTGGKAANKDKLAMPANMHDLGRLTTSQVIAAMQNVDAFLFPSRSEGFGLVAIEAMGCGLPVIAARDTAVGEVVADGSTGLLCRANEAADFAQAANRLATDTKLAVQMGAAACRHVADHFSIDVMIDCYVHLYRQLAGSQAHP